MIRVHEFTAINPVNVVYMERMKDCVFVQIWNGKGHRLMANGRDVSEMFADLIKQFGAEINLVPVRHNLVANGDAICSLGKVNDGVAVNLVVDNQKTGFVVYSFVPFEKREEEFLRLMNAVDRG